MHVSCVFLYATQQSKSLSIYYICIYSDVAVKRIDILTQADYDVYRHCA